MKEIGFDRMLACAKTNILQNQGTKIQRFTLAFTGHIGKIDECAKYVIKMQGKGRRVSVLNGQQEIIALWRPD